MQDKDKKIHESLIQDEGIYKKMFDLGICLIKNIDENNFQILLESPNIPMSKFFDSVESIWPEIEIRYSDNGFPYEIMISIDESNENSEMSRDFSDTATLKYFYNPNSISINNELLDSILREWFLFVHKRFLYIGRRDVADPKIPQDWPHDISFHRVSKSIRRTVSDIFNKLDWVTFNYDVVDYATLILYSDLENASYFSKDLLCRISERDLSLKTVISRIIQIDKEM